MIICERCSGVGGWHREYCPVRQEAKPYTTTVYPLERETRVEWFGSLQVHQPVKS